MMANDEKVLSAEIGLEPLTVEMMAKMTNEARGPKIFGTKAASVSC